MTGLANLVLASASPRRAEILRRLGISFDAAPADVDESLLPGEAPGALVERLSRAKAEAVADRLPERVVLAGDTVVALEGEILGKPTDHEDAVAMLLRLQARSHEVHSGMTVVSSGPSAGSRIVRSGVQVTTVTFRAFGEDTARAYVRTGEPLDKAGAYGIQGFGATLLRTISGDYSGVVGLPVSLLVRLLDEIGRPYRFPEEVLS